MRAHSRSIKICAAAATALAAAAVLAAGLARAARAQGSLDDAVRSYLAARTDAERDAIAPKLAAHDGLTAAAYRRAIEKTIAYPDLKAEPRPLVRKVEIADGRSIEVIVSVPPSYDPKKKAWPLLVAFMGAATDGRASIAAWAAAQKDYVIAAPSLPADTKADDPAYRGMPHYETGFKTFTALLRALPAELRIDPNRVFVTGHSHGAGIAWNCAIYQPDRVAGVIPAAGGSTYDKRNLVNLFGTSAYVIHGTHDGAVPVARSRDPVAWLVKFGYDHVYHEFDGGHDFPTAKLPDVLRWMATKERKPLPARIWQRTRPEWNATGRFFWVRIARGSGPLGPDDVVSVEGAIDAKANRIDLAVENAGALELLLNERLVDPKREVVVTVGGAGRLRGKVELRARTALDSFRLRRDLETIYPATLRIEVAGD